MIARFNLIFEIDVDSIAESDEFKDNLKKSGFTLEEYVDAKTLELKKHYFEEKLAEGFTNISCEAEIIIEE